jgi:hypothetical protein
MVLLRHLDGNTAGTETVARRFPFQVGRATGDHLRVEVPGLWENHFAIERRPGQPLTLRTRSGATTLVNGVSVETVALRNGDIIEAGALRMQFWLSAVRQPGLSVREGLTWLALAAILAFESFVAVNLTR